jgi:hypothetical protein
MRTFIRLLLLAKSLSKPQPPPSPELARTAHIGLRAAI